MMRPLGILLAVMSASLLWAAAAQAHDEATPDHGDPVSEFVRDAAARRTGVRALVAPAAPASVSPSGCATELRADDTADASAVGPQIKLVYAYASDTPDRYAVLKDDLSAAAARISQVLA